MRQNRPSLLPISLRLYFSFSAVFLAIVARASVQDLQNIVQTPKDAIIVFCNSTLNTTALVNMFCALMCMGGRAVQLCCFGEFTETEVQHVKERTLNYLLFKIVFMGAILNADFHELLVWTSWFAAMCFLRGFLSVCEERFNPAAEGASDGNRKPAFTYLYASLCICMVNVGLAHSCRMLFQNAGKDMLFLLLFEVNARFIT
mmetsp:Transcript_20831/g.29115  ORF Transcript_20831/g.29115 Transcript_20831/m.29115 type:complete len:202 (-) Transcript_20831:1205-1810(-)